MSRLSEILPHGTGALFLVQLFATLAFAILYSTLVLYTTKRLHFGVITATSIIGSFAAFNYGLHVLSGYFGGRLLSWRKLFVSGMVLQLFGCLLLSVPKVIDLYWGLGIFLVGSGLNVTCINMMVTQLFQPQDKRRESAFMWNYSGMNIGFFIGYSIAGYYQLQQNYPALFLAASMGNSMAILITLINWKKLKDKKTILTQVTRSQYQWRMTIGFCLILLMIPILTFVIKYAAISNELVVILGVIMTLIILILAMRQPEKIARQRMFAYLVFVAAALIFWTLYQIAPMGLTVFAEYNVNRHYLGFLIPPQWILNINAIIIAFGGPSFAFLFKWIRKKGYKFSLPLQFSFSLLFVGLGFILLPIGIHYADIKGMVNFNWILFSYVLQSIGELFIGPVGYAMVGQLAPIRFQGIMMGVWMMYIGVAAVFSSYASRFAVKDAVTTNPLVTNPNYSFTFSVIGYVAIGGSIALFLLIPTLRRFIQEK